jgi:antitoxin (DNA-binding transcriptional repressor) of toxin-antitoxin stability system
VARDFQAALRRAQAGAEIEVEGDAQPAAVIRAAEPVRRRISGCVAMLPADSTAVMDSDFAQDVEAAIVALREPSEPPQWD